MTTTGIAARGANSTREIAVRTASVTIKTLVIEKRQFTVAMLKQLPRIYTLGEPVDVWGFVQYPLPTGHGTTLRLHVILQAGGRLHRVSVTSRDDLMGLGLSVDAMEQLFIAV